MCVSPSDLPNLPVKLDHLLQLIVTWVLDHLLEVNARVPVKPKEKNERKKMLTVVQGYQTSYFRRCY
jgi:hypothetical protein